jgi:hypothetical protein
MLGGIGKGLELDATAHARLRAVVDEIQVEVARLSTSAAADSARLSACWSELVKLLAPGPAAQLRECPHCAQMVQRGATRCGYCWKSLPSVVVSPLHDVARPLS